MVSYNLYLDDWFFHYFKIGIILFLFPLLPTQIHQTLCEHRCPSDVAQIQKSWLIIRIILFNIYSFPSPCIIQFGSCWSVLDLANGIVVTNLGSGPSNFHIVLTIHLAYSFKQLWLEPKKKKTWEVIGDDKILGARSCFPEVIWKQKVSFCRWGKLLTPKLVQQIPYRFELRLKSLNGPGNHDSECLPLQLGLAQPKCNHSISSILSFLIFCFCFPFHYVNIIFSRKKKSKLKNKREFLALNRKVKGKGQKVKENIDQPDIKLSIKLDTMQVVVSPHNEKLDPGEIIKHGYRFLIEIEESLNKKIAKNKTRLNKRRGQRKENKLIR
ncbi:hypothetical protein VP01_32g9 [Puccinia sorghi]|uniref:Uncharacterized protein n=1 Tax=Puccinia sorghi TaxID=27349 RepID=A0A0L6UXG1_9BASI|nr:hypothetical protein VP01_32g9 [Puccinia sorghi]